jgi:hypothetical protein
MRAITRDAVRSPSRAQSLAQVVVAHAAAGSSAAALADLLDGTRTLVDHRVDIAVTSWVTHADDHRVEIDNAFQNRLRQGPVSMLITRRILYTCGVRKILAAVLVVACKSAEPPPKPAPSDLVVVSPGVLPQRLLRYQIPKGTKSTLELEVEAQLTAGEIKSTPPPLDFALSIECVDVTGDGHMKMVTTINDLHTNESPDQPGGAATGLAAAAIKGLSIKWTLAPDGTVSDATSDTAKLSPPAKAEVDQLIGSLSKIAMPLPPTPVGIGAKWRTSRALGPATQLALQSVTTVDVTGISGSVVTYELGSTVHGADQTTKMEGTDIDVKAVTGSASGRGTFDLQKLAIAGSLKAELHMDMTTGSDKTPMAMTLDLRTH